MRLTFVIIVCSIIVIVSGAGLNEEFTWSRITYRWPKAGPSKRQVQTDSRSRGRVRGKPIAGSSDPIVFDGQTNAASAGAQKQRQEVVPSFIDYKYGK